jgi:hypothetical protein
MSLGDLCYILGRTQADGQQTYNCVCVWALACVSD